MRQRGMTIGTVLLIAALAILAVFTVVAVAFFHLNFGSKVVQQQTARNLAESAIATAIAEIWTNNEYGKDRRPTVRVPSASDPEAVGLVTFDPAVAQAESTFYSVNNFESGVSVPGSTGRSVPENAVHLVGLGRAGDSRHQVEVLLYVPPFPNAIAASGTVISDGGLEVYGVQDPADYTGDPSRIEAATSIPAHVASNAGGTAITIGPRSHVDGNVLAVGTIDLDPSVTVLGEVRPNGAPQPMPNLDVDGMLARLGSVEGRDVYLAGETLDRLDLSWFAEAQGDLTVRGDLALDGGVLTVNGKLDVWGKVRGRGAVFVRGETRIGEGAALSATDLVALLSRDSVSLTGQSKSAYYFQGLVYTEGDIQAQDITVLGAVVANGPAGKGHLRLSSSGAGGPGGGGTGAGTRIVYTPFAVDMVVGLPTPVQTSGSLILKNVPYGGGPNFLNVLFGGTNIKYRDHILSASADHGVRMALNPLRTPIPGTPEYRTEKKVVVEVYFKGEPPGLAALYADQGRSYLPAFETRTEGDLTVVPWFEGLTSELPPEFSQLSEVEATIAIAQQASQFMTAAGGETLASQEQVLGKLEELRASEWQSYQEESRQRGLDRPAAARNHREATRRLDLLIANPPAPVPGQPGLNLALEVRNYFNELDNPSENSRYVLSLDLSQVFDLADSSRVLLWREI